MKAKLSIAALLCCAQLWMGCAAKNPEEADIKGTPYCGRCRRPATLSRRPTSLACIGFSRAISSTSVST